METPVQTQKDNHGYLFRIAKKRNPRGPDMEGESWIAGVRYQLAGWVNLSKKGRKYLYLKYTPVEREPR